MLIGVDFPLKGVVSCTQRLKCLNSGECVGSSYRIWMSNRDITDNFFVRIKVEQRDVRLVSCCYRGKPLENILVLRV